MAVSISKTGQLKFWHPILKRPVTRGVLKMPDDDRETMRKQLEELISKKIERWEDSPPGLTKESFLAYFGGIYEDLRFACFENYQIRTGARSKHDSVMAALAFMKASGAKVVSPRQEEEDADEQSIELAAAHTRILELERQVSDLISTVAKLSGVKGNEDASSVPKPTTSKKVNA